MALKHYLTPKSVMTLNYSLVKSAKFTAYAYQNEIKQNVRKSEKLPKLPSDVALTNVKRPEPRLNYPNMVRNDSTGIFAFGDRLQMTVTYDGRP